MSSAVTRLTSKLETKLADKDYYEAHQLYRTIYFRLQRDIKFNTILVNPEDGPGLPWKTLLENRVDFVEKNPSYEFMLDFLAKGATTLLQIKELISALDLIKLFLAQFKNHLLFQSHVMPGTANGPLGPSPSKYYTCLQKWFDRLMDVFQLYGETGLEMIRNKSAQSKGFVENDFLNERDQLLENILQISRNLRIVDLENKSEMKIRNAFIRGYGQPEMHLRNGKLLMRFQDMTKAKHCFFYGQDSFELAKFLYFYWKARHNETSEYELVLVKSLIKVFNAQLKLKEVTLTDDEMTTVKVKALNFVKEVFYYFLAISKFFLLKEGATNTASHFKQMFLLKYFHFYLIILEEFLRQEDTVPTESSYHFTTKLVRQMRRHFKFNNETCLNLDKDAEKFINFFGNRNKDYAESLSESITGDAKLYLLKLFYELRTKVYKKTITFYRQLDRELDIEQMDRIFFVYYNDVVPQNYPEIRDRLEGAGYFTPEESRAAQQPPNLFNLLLGGMAGGSSMGGGGGGMNRTNLISFLDDLMQ